MDSGRADDWRDHLIESRHEVARGSAPRFYRDVRAGSLVRLASGVYLPAQLWASLDGDERFRARIAATSIRFPDEGPFSSLSAAALWSLPTVGGWPPRVEVLANRDTGGRSRAGIIRHTVGIPPRVDDIDGYRVTTLARTVVDAAAALPFAAGVAMADFVRRRPERGEDGVLATRATADALQGALEERSTPAGRARARRAVEFADGDSGSPAESLSRCAIHVAGFPAPQLQAEFRDASGLIGRTDFFWPEARLIGEVDGYGKYLREELRHGMSAAEVVVAEKIREDRLRALGFRVVRWGWQAARSSPMLTALLVRAGLPQRRRFS
jgi:hypothetical protein